MLDLGLFKIPAFVGLSVVAFTLASSIFAMFLYLTLYIQDDLGYGPLAGRPPLPPPDTGHLLLVLLRRAADRARAVALPAGHRHARRHRRRSCSMGTTQPKSGWTVLLPGFILGGFGAGTVNPVLASGAVSVVQPQRSGMASGANNTFRQVGIATGIAVLGAVFQSQIVRAHHGGAAPRRRSAPECSARAVRNSRGPVGGAGAPGGRRRSRSRGRATALLNAYHVGLLDHAQPPDGHRRRGRVRRCGRRFVLVRQRDFVVPTASAGPPGAGGQRRPRRPARPEDAGVPAGHA